MKQKLKRKVASAVKKMQESMMDDSVELHALEDSLCGPTAKIPKSDGSTPQKSHPSKSSATSGHSSSVQSKVALPPKSNGSSGTKGPDGHRHQSRDA